MSQTNLHILPVLMFLLISCSGHGNVREEIAGAGMTGERAEQIARESVKAFSADKKRSFRGLQTNGTYEVTSLWPDRNDVWLVLVSFSPSDPERIWYGMVPVDRLTKKPVFYGVDNPIHPLSEDKYRLYFDEGWIREVFTKKQAGKADLHSCRLVLVTPDTPGLDPMNWGFAVWAAIDTAGQIFFISQNGRIHEIDLHPEAKQRIWPGDKEK